MSVDKSERKSGLTPFKPGPNPKRGRGPKKGAPNAGRPPDWLKARMGNCRELAVDQTHDDLLKKNLNANQRIKLVKEWAPPDEQQPDTPTLIVKFVRE